MTTADSDIMRASGQDPSAFAIIFERHYDAIYRLVARRLGHEVAGDIAAEAFAVAFRKRHEFDVARSSARPWLVGIALNLVARERRQYVRHFEALERLGAERSFSFGDAGADPAATSEARAQWAVVAHALLAMPATDRELLLLIAWEEQSYQEAAEALALPIGTVRSRLSRARSRLRDSLRREDITNG